jgi:hypothetical protein
MEFRTAELNYRNKSKDSLELPSTKEAEFQKIHYELE